MSPVCEIFSFPLPVVIIQHINHSKHKMIPKIYNGQGEFKLKICFNYFSHPSSV